MKKRNLIGSVCLLLVLVTSVLMTACAAPPPAEKPIVLRFATHMPATDTLAMTCMEWMAKITKETRGRVLFDTYYAETLISAKDAWEELLKGACDVYLVSAHTSPGPKVMPLYLMLNNAWIGVKDQATQLSIQQQLLREFPELAAEWAPVKPLSIFGILEFNIHSTKPIRTLADFKGKQLRGLAGWPKATVEALGGSLVSMPLGDVYIALQKGILDGLFHDNSSLLGAWMFSDLCKSTTLLGGVFPGLNSRICMNLNSWNRLPPDIQKIFEDKDLEKWVNERYIELRKEALVKVDVGLKGRHEFISLPPADLARIHELMYKEAAKSAEALDAKGLPGTKLLERLRQLVKETK